MLNKEKYSTESLKEKISEILSKNELGHVKETTLEYLTEELKIYHQELIYQNEELMRIRTDLEESEKNYIDIFNNAPIGYVILDSSGIIKKANKTFLELLELEKNDVKEVPFSNFISPESQDEYYFHFRDLKRNLNAQNCTIFISKNSKVMNSIFYDLENDNLDEKKLYVNLISNVYNEENNTYTRISIVDITENRKNEIKLIESERRLKEAQILAKMGSWEIDLISNKALWSDEMYNIFELDKKIFNYSYESSLDATVHPDDREFVNNAFTNAIKNKKPYDIIHRILTKEDEIKYVNEKCTIEHDSLGIPIKAVGTTQDITERRIADEEIKRLNDTLEKKVIERTGELESANKDLEAFAYSISHDLRAPLRHIDGFSTLLKKQIPEPTEESERFFNKIAESVTKMSNMIDGLLKFSRLGRKVIDKVDVDLNILIRAVINQYKIEIENRKIEFKIGLLPIVQGDYTLLQVVFENLISNAIKFTSKKELAIIEIDQCKNNTKECTIYIRDNGAGFDMHYEDKLFKVFQRLHTEKEFDGTGIGLANIKQILQKHGGHIKAEGSVDNGATFYLYL